MWSAIFTALAVVGAMYTFRAWRSRDAPTMPHGVPEGTPVAEWPDHERKNKQQYHEAEHWQLYLVFGIIAFIIGATGAVFLFIDDVSSAGRPTRDELLDLVAEADSNTLDRNEAACLFDVFDELGIDITESDDLSPQQFVESMIDMPDAQLERLDSCIDAETRANRGASVTDAELRDLMIDLLAADPVAGFEDAEAECIVDFLDARDLLRVIVQQSPTLSPEIDATILEAELSCL